MRRLFVAVALPEPVTQRLQTLADAYGAVVARMVPAEQWHLTLHFLGQVENWRSLLHQLTPAITWPFVPTITLTHVGPGAAGGQLWAYARSTPALEQLQRTIVQRCAAAIPGHVQPVRREFLPHVRLAKLADEANTRLLAAVPVHETFIVTRVQLYRSEFNQQGVRYTELASCAITP